MTTWNESATQNRHMLKTLEERCQIGLKYDHLKTENVPHNSLNFSPGTKCLEPGTKYSDLMRTMSAFNCLYFDHYFSDRAEIFQQ